MLYLPSLWFHCVAQHNDDEGKCVALNMWSARDTHSSPAWGVGITANSAPASRAVCAVLVSTRVVWRIYRVALLSVRPSQVRHALRPPLGVASTPPPTGAARPPAAPRTDTDHTHDTRRHTVALNPPADHWLQPSSTVDSARAPVYVSKCCCTSDRQCVFIDRDIRSSPMPCSRHIEVAPLRCQLDEHRITTTSEALCDG